MQRREYLPSLCSEQPYLTAQECLKNANKTVKVTLILAEYTILLNLVPRKQTILIKERYATSKINKYYFTLFLDG